MGPDLSAKLGAYAKTSLLDMLRRTPGLPQDTGGAPADQCPRHPGQGIPDSAVVTIDSMLSFLDNHVPAFSQHWPAPGTHYTYSNLSWALMGLAAADLPAHLNTDPYALPGAYAAQLATLVTTACGATNTEPYFTLPDKRVLPVGYEPESMNSSIYVPVTDFVPPVYRSQTGDGRLVSTGADLAAFLRWNMNCPPNSPCAMAMHSFSPQQGWPDWCDEWSTTTGLGWFVDDYDDAAGTCVVKNGAVRGFTCWMGLDTPPNSQWGLAVLTNGPDADDLAGAALSVLPTMGGITRTRRRRDRPRAVIHGDC